jgi:hypothetical protein
MKSLKNIFFRAFYFVKALKSSAGRAIPRPGHPKLLNKAYNCVKTVVPCVFFALGKLRAIIGAPFSAQKPGSSWNSILIYWYYGQLLRLP